MKEDKNNIQLQITQFYREILQRKPEDSDINFWLKKVISKQIELSDIPNHFEYLMQLKKKDETNHNSTRLFSLELQEDYAKNKFKEIKGWVVEESTIIISSLSKIQNELGMRGSVGEIGVQYGKLFLVLHLMLNEGERSFAVDVFENQDLNLDKSGHSDYEIFAKNLQKYGNPKLVDVFSDSSLNLSPDDIISKSGKARILSIDGGHTPEVVLNDFKLGESILENGGVIILDDYFNPEWPGVSQGTNEYFFNHKSKLRPFAYTMYKVFFTNDEKISNQYLDYFKIAHLDKIQKFTRMFNNDVIFLRSEF